MGTPAPTVPHVQLSKAVRVALSVGLAVLHPAEDFEAVLDEGDVKEGEERVHELEQARLGDQAVLVLRRKLVVFCSITARDPRHTSTKRGQ